MPASGHISETVQFPLEGADSVTGVKFGQGRASFSVIADDALEAQVPNTATWDKVVFQKQNITEIFSIVATGDGEAGAYSALTGQIDSLGYYSAASGCSTGQVTFSNHNQPSGVCVIYATGSSVATASGIMEDAYGSGFCGGPTGFAAGSYAASQTRLSGISVDPMGNDTSRYAALGLVQYTGGLNVKQASTTITCLTTGIQSETSYKFVPIPEVGSTTYAPSGGGEITIIGSCFSSVSGVSIGPAQDILFSVTDNSTISGQVPTGIFEDFIHLKVQSGISMASSIKYTTSGEVEAFKIIPNLFIFAGEPLTIQKGSVGVAIVNGSGFSDLTEVHFLSKHLEKVEVTGINGFSYTSGQIFAPISGVETGFHDLVVSRLDQSVTGINYLKVLDSVQTSYSYKTLLTSGFEYVNEEISLEQLKTVLDPVKWEFEHTGKADRISLEFSGGSITSGSVTFELDKAAGHNNTVNNTYTIKGHSISSEASVTNAYNKWGSGIFTIDKWDNPYVEGVSYKLNNRVCGIASENTYYYAPTLSFSSTGLYTGVVTGDPNNLPLITQLSLNNDAQFLNYTAETNLNCSISSRALSSGIVSVIPSGTGIHISTTGFSAEDNMTWINSEISDGGSYPDYALVSTTTGITDNYENYSYTSGVTFSFPTARLNGLGDSIWSNLLSSGLNDLYPNGWAGEHSLTSGFSIVTGSPSYDGELTFTGVSVAAANSKVIDEMANNYSKCSSGDPTYFNSGEEINVYGTGYFYGYCTGETDPSYPPGGDEFPTGCHGYLTLTGQLSGQLTGLIHSTNTSLSGEYGNFSTLSYDVVTGRQAGSFNLCNQFATGATSEEALFNLTGWLQPEFYNSGRCVAGDMDGIIIDRFYLKNINVSFSAPVINNDGGSWSASSSGFVDAKHYVGYNPRISGNNTGITVSTTCPTTDIAVNFQRNRLIYDTTGLITSPAHTIRRFITTLNVACTGYETTLEANCLKYYNGREKLGKITFYENIKDAWSGYLDDGSYRLEHVSGSFMTNLEAHTLGSGTVNVDKYV